MKYMLDTNICIYMIKYKPDGMLAKLRSAIKDGVCISVVTLAELEHGITMSAHPEKNSDALVQFLTVIEVLPFDAKAASAYGAVRAGLQRNGTLIGQMDLLIAAHALANGCVVVTNNTREFVRVGGLAVEDWSIL